MTWALFALGAALSWGIYGVLLFKGQVGLGHPMKALLCVGVAYFVMAVVVPVANLGAGGLSGFTGGGTTMATIAGALGAAGAICIIFAFKSGGVPNFVMPIVFGGAPVVNTLLTMTLNPPKDHVNPLVWVGVLVTVVGASMVLYFRPSH
jgi:uncharacterized membrane protein